MRNFLKLCLIFVFAVLTVGRCFANDNKVLVLPDDIDFSSTNYFIYPDSAVVFASDTINELKKGGNLETVSMTEVRDALRKNTKLTILTKKALQEYKYNYNIPFVDFREIAHTFSTNKILIITSQTDIQNEFLRRTIWDILNIPGAAVIDPAYKISTFASLIDVDKELVIWQKTYYKSISAKENGIIATNFAPATEQLEKIKSYSTYFLAPEIARKIEGQFLVPAQVLPDDTNMVNVSDKSDKDVSIEELQDNLEVDNNILRPKKNNPKNYGVIINDL